jgi:hypothetical protein
MSLLLEVCKGVTYFNKEWYKTKIYRTISLLPGLSKLIERIVYKQLYEYCSENNYLNHINSGYKKMTTCQLLHIVNNIYTSIDTGDGVCVVFHDVSKAFDRVWHEGLLHKLKHICVSGALFRWFESYLTDRKRCRSESFIHLEIS